MSAAARALLSALALPMVACLSGTASPATPANLTRVFGPVLGYEPIVGRVEEPDGRILLLTAGDALVSIDLEHRTAARTPIAIADAHCWGLVRLDDGALWTLKDRGTLAQLDERGREVREVALHTSHLGVSAIGSHLLLEPVAMDPPAPALRLAAPGDATGVPWSGMTTRRFEGFNRGAVMALNLVSCGIGLNREMPCWFPDEPAISLIDASGRTRRVELAGLYRVSPEALIASDTPPRPVRDVYIDRAGTIWVLSSGTPPEHPTDLPGGWVVARYGSHGEAIDRRRLSEPIRLILRAGSGKAVLLTGAGMVSELPS